MKVLIVFNHPAPYKVKLFNELSKYVDLTVIFERSKARNRPKEFYSENKYDFNCKILKTGYFGNEGSFSSKVRSFIRKHHKEYDFIIMNGYSHFAEMKAIFYMQKHKIPYGLMVNGGLAKNDKHDFIRILKTRLISRASFWLSPTDQSDEYLFFYDAIRSKIFRYPYSNISNDDLVREYPDKETLRKKYNLPLDTRIFINACQFIERKNNMKLIELFEDKPETLLLIGDGPCKKSYLKYIKEKNLKNVIIMPFKGKEELFEILHACDVHITLAKYDVFGQTTIEALASGLPVISSTKVLSANEYIKDGINGFIVDLKYKTKIDEAIKNSQLLSAKNAIKSIKFITFENCAIAIRDILLSLKK